LLASLPTSAMGLAPQLQGLNGVKPEQIGITSASPPPLKPQWIKTTKAPEGSCCKARS